SSLSFCDGGVLDNNRFVSADGFCGALGSDNDSAPSRLAAVQKRLFPFLAAQLTAESNTTFGSGRFKLSSIRSSVKAVIGPLRNGCMIGNTMQYWSAAGMYFEDRTMNCIALSRTQILGCTENLAAMLT